MYRIEIFLILFCFRKEVIARKRLERAQDRDGLHVDLAEIAQRMLDFASSAVLWRLDEPVIFEGDESPINRVGEPADVDESEHSSGTESSESSECHEEHAQPESFQETNISDDMRTLGKDEQVMTLEPLSGYHLKAVKRLAGYFRLKWTEKGGGKCRSLVLTARPGPQPSPEKTAAESLISKYTKIENGATTKRLPTASCTPQFSGSQVSLRYLSSARVVVNFFCDRLISLVGKRGRQDSVPACLRRWALN